MKALLPLLAFSFALAAPSVAQPPDEAARLREALRNTALQLRSVQTDLANAQATAAAAEQKNRQLEEQLAETNEKLTTQIKRASEDRTSADQTIATLNNRLAEREKRLSEYTAALEKWKAAYQNAASTARTKEAERGALATEAAVLKRTVADRETKNIALFNTAREILQRYEDHATGKAILAKEPFIGTARVKIENLVQGYHDRILDNRISAPSKPNNP